ncbi:CBL-interacting protein kinase 23 [Camellia lanceoleosa]|uniref:CBL-interacting protein kinase 23 n=1 Tax=Camellia lanceoleosa TaxID=1840588 RepID=A0ACC0IHD0_9ERIC|nr:CBL-interacting protein kinase 23 [Camellia lanceoleosa]
MDTWKALVIHGDGFFLGVQTCKYQLKLQGEKTGRKGYLSIATEGELRKAGGDTLEFHKCHYFVKGGILMIMSLARWNQIIDYAIDGVG